MDMSIPGLERLEAWSKSMDFALLIYKEVLPILPPEEKWGLSQQMRRSAQSVPANIAEGYGRYYYQDNVRFCYLARGSLEELLSHLVLAHKIGSVPTALFVQLADQGNNLVRLINGYIAYLKRSKQGGNEPGAPSVIREDLANFVLDDQDITSDL
jgi:four helix bundle protein